MERYWNPSWSRTRVFSQAAHDLILCLNNILGPGVDLFSMTPEKAKVSLRRAMFIEVTNFWISFICISGITKRIHPLWEPRNLCRLMVTKKANSAYHFFAVGRGDTMTRRKLCGKSETDHCRFGCNAQETIDHLFFDCSHLMPKKRKLKTKLEHLKLDYTLANLFTNDKIQHDVEQYISFIITY